MNHKTDSKDYLDINKLDYGYVYVVRGPSDRLIWGLKDDPNVVVTLTIPNDVLTARLRNPSLDYDVKTTYLVYKRSGLSLPDNLTLWPEYRCFIWLPSLSRELSRTDEKFYKHYSGGCYRQVDLWDIDYSHDKTLIALKNSTPTEISRTPEYSTVLSYYKHLPIKLHYLLKNPKFIPLDQTIHELCNLRDMIVSLAGHSFDEYVPDYQRVLDLCNLPEKLLTKYFVCDYMNSSILYPHTKSTFYVMLRTYRSSISIGCKHLAYWYDLYMKKIPTHNKTYPQDLVKLFILWVYNSTVKWGYNNKKGFRYFHKQGKRIYYFSPSTKAIREFYKLVS